MFCIFHYKGQKFLVLALIKIVSDKNLWFIILVFRILDFDSCCDVEAF